MMISLTALFAASLATWRLTHLLHAENGPGDAFARLRASAAGRFAGEALGCFFCLSFFLALPFAAAIAPGFRDAVIAWFAISGGACLLEQATARPSWSDFVKEEE